MALMKHIRSGLLVLGETKTYQAGFQAVFGVQHICYLSPSISPHLHGLIQDHRHH